MNTTYSPTLPTTLRQVALSITGTGSVAQGDREYLTDAADALESGSADAMQVEDAISIAREYQEASRELTVLALA